MSSDRSHLAVMTARRGRGAYDNHPRDSYAEVLGSHVTTSYLSTTFSFGKLVLSEQTYRVVDDDGKQRRVFSPGENHALAFWLD